MKIPLVLISIFAIAIVTVGVLVRLIRMDGFAFAWALNFVLMFFTLAFVEALNSDLGLPYFKEQAWERRGKFYELLGISLFRKLLVLVGWEKLNKKANPVGKSIAALSHLHHQTKKSELGHAAIFLIVLGFSIYVAVVHGLAESKWLFVLDILLNLYPIFLQRYNRPRIERAINVSRRRHGVTS
jgi:hypothetical protein